MGIDTEGIGGDEELVFDPVDLEEVGTWLDLDLVGRFDPESGVLEGSVWFTCGQVDGFGDGDLFPGHVECCSATRYRMIPGLGVTSTWGGTYVREVFPGVFDEEDFGVVIGGLSSWGSSPRLSSCCAGPVEGVTLSAMSDEDVSDDSLFGPGMEGGS